MKSLFVAIGIFLSVQIKSQIHTVTYRADKIFNEAVENYMTLDSKVVLSKLIGVNVFIKIDTVFNKYTVSFTDENQKQTEMVYYYVNDKVEGLDAVDNKINKLFVVKWNDTMFYLTDYIKIFKSLEICYIEKLENKYVARFRIDGIKKLNN